MSAIEMRPAVASAVRAELASIGTGESQLQRHQRRSRFVLISLGAIVLVGITTAGALVVGSLPGTTTVAPLGGVVSATHTGEASIDLGPVPAHAGAVLIVLTCLNHVGQITVETNPQGGSATSMSVDCAFRGIRPIHIRDGLLPTAGSRSIAIEADPGTQWKAVAQYASSSIAPWGVNSSGETFGVPNDNGEPDLTSTRASNGKLGYTFTKQLDGSDAPARLPVYLSDGTTVIGHMSILLGKAVPLIAPPTGGN